MLCLLGGVGVGGIVPSFFFLDSWAQGSVKAWFSSFFFANVILVILKIFLAECHQFLLINVAEY